MGSVAPRPSSRVGSAAGPLAFEKIGLLVPDWVHLNPDLPCLWAPKVILGNQGEELAVAEARQVHPLE